MAQSSGLQELAEKWVVLCDAHNQACKAARIAEQTRENCAAKLVAHEKAMSEVVGNNIPEKVAVVGDSVVIIRHGVGIKRLPKAE